MASVEKNMLENIELRYMKDEDQESGEKIIFMEFPEELMGFLTSEKKPCLTLKADHSRKSTVLCSPSKTYSLRNVTQTNSLLLFQKEDDGFSLLKDARSYIEITEATVHINFNHLAPVYDGYDLHVPDTVPLYTLSQIKRRIPASDEEIHYALIHSMCLVINGLILRDVYLSNHWFLGHLRRLSFNYVLRVLQLILAHAEVENMSLDELKFDLLMTYIDSEEPADVVELVLRRFSHTQTESYSIDGSSIAQWIGIQMLAKCKGSSVLLDEFIRDWKSTIPSPFSEYADLSLLQGEYLLTGSSTIQYFPANELSIDPAIRFQELFLAQPKWNLPDILPFIRGLATDETKIDSLLRKFTRKQTICQQTILTARNPWKS
ncbi:uncharacterized protein T551_01804 [Pneumocystis jirovecii RU7]|uniref:Sister chromatid cohesion protein DCC1 n=1 Tax=Pneumocystis jirovecii (strain RU7) TaxID=1408657 RepID=A0A0W4ZQ73_PNEJ7|nr:uncharacterized protein T551_01804 [Pneumocystis jirovecii RU7]KTW30521.1 hypothetical protein T551_01804 [Pneumocystis jirovecii RU7]